jgi:hypothetical protein
MSEQIRDITSEHVGPMGSDNDARLVRQYLYSYGWKATGKLSAVAPGQWEDAVRFAIHTTNEEVTA